MLCPSSIICILAILLFVSSSYSCLVSFLCHLFPFLFYVSSFHSCFGLFSCPHFLVCVLCILIGLCFIISSLSWSPHLSSCVYIPLPESFPLILSSILTLCPCFFFVSSSQVSSLLPYLSPPSFTSPPSFPPSSLSFVPMLLCPCLLACIFPPVPLGLFFSLVCF